MVRFYDISVAVALVITSVSLHVQQKQLSSYAKIDVTGGDGGSGEGAVTREIWLSFIIFIALCWGAITSET